MKTISKVALAAALSFGAVTTLGVSPAIAQKKEKAKAPQFSEAFRKAATEADAKINAKDWAGAEPLVAASEAAAKSNEERYYAQVARLKLEDGRQNAAGKTAALDALIANPATPAEQQGFFNFHRGVTAIQAKKPAEALPFLKKAQQLGYQDPDGQLPVLIAGAQGDTGDAAGAAASMEQAIAAKKAAGQKPPEDWYNYVVARLYKSGDRTGTANWLMREVADYPGPENWRKIILVYRESRGKANEALPRQEKLDLYRLQRATGALAGGSDYVDYANAAQNSGLPWEAKKVIDEGRASGKLTANDANASTIYSVATKSLAAEKPLATYEKQASTDATGKLSAQTADAYLASGEYAKAATLYRAALQKGSVNTDEVNTRLGIALANSSDKAGAKAAFAEVKQAPRVDIAKFWMTYLDLQGGASAGGAQ